MKTVIAIPARNSEKTIESVYDDVPLKYKKNIIISDDGSKDNTLKIAKKLGIKIFKNHRRPGYGSNVKNCFNNSIQEGADIVVILHSDNQYDATKIPKLCGLIEKGEADFVWGSRILGDKAKGMSAFRFFGNRVLGYMENIVMGTKLTDLHSGLIAVRSSLLKSIPYKICSDDYIFHTEIILQSHYAGASFWEIGIPTRYENISTSISVYKSMVYAYDTFVVIARYLLHKVRIIKSPMYLIRPFHRKI